MRKVQRVKVQGAARVRLLERCKEMYENGMPIRAIAEKVEWSYGMVHGLLTSNGVVLRSRGGNHAARKSS